MARLTGREGGAVDAGRESEAPALTGDVTTAAEAFGASGWLYVSHPAKSASDAPETCRNERSWNEPSSTFWSFDSDSRVVDRANGLPIGMKEDRRDDEGRRFDWGPSEDAALFAPVGVPRS